MSQADMNGTIRSSITLFEDQYQFFKELKSKRLLIAFVEFMFEDKEPEWLNWIEKTVFNSLRNRMENSKNLHDGNSKGWKKSHWWWRKGKANSELSWENKSKTSQGTSQKQLKNNEEEVEDNNILSYDNIYSAYYWKKKWIDVKVCDKLINSKLKQGITLDDIKKWMVLYNCECWLKQEWQYVKKFETRIKEFQPLNENDIEQAIRMIARNYRQKVNNDANFQNSQSAKTIWTDLCGTFDEQKLREIWKSEWRKQITLITH